MHDTAYELGRVFFDNFVGKKNCRVLDLGSLDLNGSLRDFAQPNVDFIGADMEHGKSVDVVLEDPHKLPFEDGAFDFVVSSSCFEHDNFFWISFLEICRVTKEGGFIYVNSPSNGDYHTHPMDCWRFYPDSGQALVQWANKNGMKTTLVESFIAHRKKEVWNDFVMVATKRELASYSGPFLSDHYQTVNNLRKFPHDKVTNYDYRSEDTRIIQSQRASLTAFEQRKRDVDIIGEKQAVAEALLRETQGETKAMRLHHDQVFQTIMHKLDSLELRLQPVVSGPSSLETFFLSFMSESGKRAAKETRLAKDAAYLRNCSRFDPFWYLSRYPDVERAGMDPANHYVFHGEPEGRLPTPDFKIDLRKILYYRRQPGTGSYFVRYLQLFQNECELDSVPRSGEKSDQKSGSSVTSVMSFFEGQQPTKYSCDNKLEVLVIGHEASLTGAPLALLDLIQELTQKYPVNAHMVLLSGGPLLERYRCLVPVLVLSDLTHHTGSREKSIELLASHFARIPGPKVALGNTIVIDEAFCEQLKKRKVPYALWIHEMADFVERHSSKEKIRYLAENSSAMIFASEFNFQDNASRFGLERNNLKLIELGFRVKENDPDRAAIRKAVREKLGLSADAQIVLGCGTLEHRKGVDLFVQVAVQYLAEHPKETNQVHFVWLGRFAFKEFLDNLKLDVKAAMLEDRIHFVGEDKNPHPYFQGSDTFLLTSRSEPMGLVALEAIASHLPVLVFKQTSGAEKYIARGYGCVVPCLDCAAMSHELHGYLAGQSKIKDDGDIFLEHELNVTRFGKRFYDVIRELAPVGSEVQTPEKSVLVITPNWPPLNGHRAEGGGLRAWGLARSIKHLLPDHEVTLCYFNRLPENPINGLYDGVHVKEVVMEALKKQVQNASTVVVRYCMGDISRSISESLRPEQQLILDCYIPSYVEVSARKSSAVQFEYDQLLGNIPHLNATLKRGDFFLCANQAQNAFYQGVLAALGKINPKTYRDPGLRIVPYGIDSDQPVPKEQPIKKLLGSAYDKTWKILWFGAVYPWFNIGRLIDAVHFVNQQHPTQLIMVGASNPFTNHPDFVAKARDVQELTSRPGYKEIIRLHDWVRFEDRADWYLDCDLIITLNEPGMENGLSWRTRVADYVWAGMPVASNGGDPLTEELITCGAAGRLNITNTQTLADDICKILADQPRLKSMKAQMQLYRPKLYWDNVVAPLREVISDHKLAPDRIS